MHFRLTHKDCVILNVQYRLCLMVAMQIEEALINDRLRVSEVSWKFHIPTIYKPKVSYFLTVSIVFSVYRQNFTAQ